MREREREVVVKVIAGANCIILLLSTYILNVFQSYQLISTEHNALSSYVALTFAIFTLLRSRTSNRHEKDVLSSYTSVCYFFFLHFRISFINAQLRLPARNLNSFQINRRNFYVFRLKILFANFLLSAAICHVYKQ